VGVCAAQRAAVRLLGGFELTVDDTPVSVAPGAQRVLAFLALRDRPVLRAHIAGMLWLETTEEHAFANLRSTLWRLRRSADGLVAAYGQQLALRPDVDVDLRASAALARALLTDADRPRDLYELELDLDALRTDILPDWYDDWIVFERERFRQLRLHALDALAELFLELGRPARAMETALSAVSAEPLRESAHRAVIRIHLAEGNAAEAVRQYQLYRRLAGEFGLQPSDQIRLLVKGIEPAETHG
jgi:DNA-binding SARP family transcriptional activator